MRKANGSFSLLSPGPSSVFCFCPFSYPRATRETLEFECEEVFPLSLLFFASPERPPLLSLSRRRKQKRVEVHGALLSKTHETASLFFPTSFFFHAAGVSESSFFHPLFPFLLAVNAMARWSPTPFFSDSRVLPPPQLMPGPTADRMVYLPSFFLSSTSYQVSDRSPPFPPHPAFFPPSLTGRAKPISFPLPMSFFSDFLFPFYPRIFLPIHNQALKRPLPSAVPPFPFFFFLQ